LFGEALNWERIDLGKTLENPETRSVNMVQIGRALTGMELDPPIKALFVYNANPAVIAPDQNAVIRGLEREDLFTVVLEHFITDTARYADYIFPATTQLEHWDLMDSWGHVYLNLNQPAIAPLGESKPNSEIFRLLARAMDLQDEYFLETDLEIIQKTLDSSHRYLEGITFESLKKTGWAKLNLPKPLMPLAIGSFKTPSGKCELYSKSMQEKGLSPMPEYTPIPYSKDDKEAWPLHLLTVKSPRNFLNTCHANVKHLKDKEGEPRLDIHPSDAVARSLTDGDLVSVFNKKGKLTLTARLSERVRPGVVCMPQGYWTFLVKGGSTANALTHDRLTDMGRGAALQEAKVQVKKI
jgi:anaerobic selenocysteine-containing dehydrogenase